MIETIIWMIVGAVVGGFGRVRSGVWGAKAGWGAARDRIFAWAIPMAILGALAGPPGLSLTALWTFLGFVVAWWVGCLAGWWGTLDLGPDTGDRETEIFWHSVRGALSVLPAIALWCFLGNWWALFLLIPGVLCGPIYEAGRQVATAYRTKTGRTDWGEIFFGAAIGLTAALVA